MRFFRHQNKEISIVSVILSLSHKKDATKQILKYIMSLSCLYINLKIACEIIAILQNYI